jgi:hypothetical protein
VDPTKGDRNEKWAQGDTRRFHRRVGCRCYPGGASDAEPEYEYPSRMAKKKDFKKMGRGPRTRRKKEKKGK